MEALVVHTASRGEGFCRGIAMDLGDTIRQGFCRVLDERAALGLHKHRVCRFGRRGEAAIGQVALIQGPDVSRKG